MLAAENTVFKNQPNFTQKDSNIAVTLKVVFVMIFKKSLKKKYQQDNRFMVWKIRTNKRI